MKKTLSFVLVGLSLFALSGCKKKEDKIVIKDDFYEPQINVPQIFVSKDSTFANNKALEDYLLQFAKVTFDDDHLNEEFDITINTGTLNVDALHEVGKFSVSYTINYDGHSKTQTATVDVVDRGVVGVVESNGITPFTPSFNMTGNTLIDYTENLGLTDSNGKTIVIADALASGKIVIDDVTVRLSVPGVHLVKFIITCENNYKYYYYREVKVLESEIPTKQQFETYFNYDADGLSCKRGVVYPKFLLVPSKFKDGETIVNVDKYNYLMGCNFRDHYGDNSRDYTNRTRFRNVETIIYDKGHKELPTGFFAIDFFNKEASTNEPTAKNTPSIKYLHLPETLITIGFSIVSGTDIVDVIIPRSVEMVYRNVFAQAFKVQTVIFLGMPISERGSTASIVEYFFAHFERKSVYFFIDYMLGVSPDETRNALFRDTYLWMRTHDKIHNLNSFANYNKIIL